MFDCFYNTTAILAGTTVTTVLSKASNHKVKPSTDFGTFGTFRSEEIAVYVQKQSRSARVHVGGGSETTNQSHTSPSTSLFCNRFSKFFSFADSLLRAVKLFDMTSGD